MEQHQRNNEIADTMGHIKEKSGCPVSQSGTDAAGNKIRQGTKGAESQPKESGENAPEKNRAVLPEKENHQCQNTPDIEIAEPPHPEAITESLKQHKGVYDEEYFFSACQGIEDDEQADHFDIGQDCQKDLSQKQYGGQKAKNCQLADILLCQINSLLSESAQRYPDPV